MNMQQGHGMQYGHGHVAWAWTWTCSLDKDTYSSMDLVMWHGPGQGHAWMHGCRNAETKLCPASLVSASCNSPASAFRHHGQSSTADHGLIR
jgi:hypothetical protein